MGAKKLTLRIDEDVIERAKAYSNQNDLSLSYLVGRYLENLTDEDHAVMPTVERLIGTIPEND